MSSKVPRLMEAMSAAKSFTDYITDLIVKSYFEKYSKTNENIKKIDLRELKEFMVSQGDFLTRLLENPTLFEHELFTELLRTVFHLYEELAYRKKISMLVETDMKHIMGDIERC